MANGNFAGGDGTAQNPYLIEDAFDLDAMRNSLTAHYKLIKDIDLDVAPFNEGEGWVPIGTGTQSNRFRGLLNGNSFAIRNLYINRPSNTYVGLFGTGSINVHDLALLNVNIVGGGRTGAIVGTGAGHYERCYVTGVISGTSYVGGLIGQTGFLNFGTNTFVKDVCISANIISRNGSYAGGITGYLDHNRDLTIENSCFYGEINSSTKRGLIAGRSTNSRINVLNSFWDIDTSGTTLSEGGGIGLTTSEMKDSQTFINAGWDTDVWYLVEGKYPMLASLLTLNNKVFAVHKSQYKYFNGEEWKLLSAPPTEQDYIDYGMDVDFVSGLSTSAWIELDGEVELHFYTDDERVSESTLTIHTEPFDLYEELGGSVEILYYTEDSSITEPKLIIEANYSPLDELEGDFEVVTWMEDEDAEPKIQMTALPNPRVVIPLQNLNIAGDLQKLTLNTTIDDEDYGVVRVAASGDGGQTWKSFKNGDWIDVELIGQDKIRYYWMSPEDIESITGEEWRQLNSDQNIRLAYYIRQDDIDLTVKIDSLVSNEIATIETPTLSSLTIVYNELDRKYSGLMFMDTTQEYYSTSFGEIIKYLDMGTMIAGQTSFDINVKLTNTYPFDVSNIHLWSEHDIEGLTVEFSKTINPFISENELFYDQVLGFDEVIDFYIRLSTSDDAEGSGSFDIRVSADQA